MNTIDLAAMRQRLEDMRQEYAAQIKDLTTGEDQVLPSDPQHDGAISDDPADDADAMYDAERNIALADNARDQLEQVENALARIANGKYGICAACGKVIDARRLEALPYVQYCLEDQERIEHDVHANGQTDEVMPGTPPI